MAVRDQRADRNRQPRHRLRARCRIPTAGGRPFDFISATLNALAFGLFFVGADALTHGEGTSGARACRSRRRAFLALAALVRREVEARRAADPGRPAAHSASSRLSVATSICSFTAQSLALRRDAVLFRIDARPQPGRDRAADDAVAGGGRRRRADRRPLVGSRAGGDSRLRRARRAGDRDGPACAPAARRPLRRHRLADGLVRRGLRLLPGAQQPHAAVCRRRASAPGRRAACSRPRG